MNSDRATGESKRKSYKTAILKNFIHILLIVLPRSEIKKKKNTCIYVIVFIRHDMPSSFGYIQCATPFKDYGKLQFIPLLLSKIPTK